MPSAPTTILTRPASAPFCAKANRLEAGINMRRLFDLQGHRGARGLKPENTLPGFEIAIDIGVTSVETDIHLTSDGVPVLYHEAAISERLCRLLPKITGPDPFGRPPVRSLTLAQLRT